MFPYDVQQIVFGDQPLVRTLLGSPSFPPLLFVEVWRVEELWGQNGAGGLHPVHNLEEQSLVVVIEKGDRCSSVSEPPRPANLHSGKSSALDKWSNLATDDCV